MPHLDLSFSDELKQKHSVVLNGYRKPNRKYHNIEHLETMFEGLDNMREWLKAEKFEQRDIDMIRDLIIYHDAVYEVGSEENEKLSAALMVADLNLSEHDTLIAEASILATKAKHKHTTDHLAASPRAKRIADVLCDLDLYAFALPYDRYRLTSLAVRAELAPDLKRLNFDYYVGNVRFLLMYMEEDHLYNTPYARARWEQHSRNNILSIIAEMSTELQGCGRH